MKTKLTFIEELETIDDEIQFTDDPRVKLRAEGKKEGLKLGYKLGLNAKKTKKRRNK